MSIKIVLPKKNKKENIMLVQLALRVYCFVSNSVARIFGQQSKQFFSANALHALCIYVRPLHRQFLPSCKPQKEYEK
jgi:hypothetical protein